MAKNTGIAALFDRSYRTGDPQLDALFGLTDIQEEELPPLRAPERREAQREEAPREMRGQERVRGKGRVLTTASKGLSPEARALLDTIAGDESPDYNTVYGGRKVSDLSRHPGIAVPIRSGPNAGKTSSAAGRYQFLGSTWNDQAKKLGLTDFSPESQDLAAWNLAKESYGPGLEEALRSGDPAEIARVGHALRKVWTSLPGGIEQGARASTFSNRFQQNLGAESAEAPTQTYTPPQLASTQAPQESPYYPVRLSDGQIFDVEKGMSLDEVDAMLKQNNINARPLRPYTAPDGQEFDVEYDMTDDEINAMLAKQAQPAEESNRLGALKYGAQQSIAGIAQGAGTEIGELGKAIDPYSSTIGGYLQEKGPQLHAYGEQLDKDIAGTYQRPKGLNWFEENIEYPALETAGQMAPYAAAGALSVLPGGQFIAPAAMAGMTHAGVMGGGEQEAEAAGKEFVPSEYRFPYAAASDVANLAGFQLFNKALKVFGQEAILGSREAIKAAVEKGGIEEAKKLVGSRLGNIAKETGKAELGLIGGEVIEDAINREYLDKPLLSEEAFQQYGETAKQVGPLGLFTGPFAGVGTRLNKQIEVARLEEQADVAEKLEAQEMERAKAENLATIGVTPEQLQKFGVRKEIEGLSEEELLQAYQADLAEKEAAKAAKIAELPEDLRDVPYREAKRFQQMQEEIAAGVPDEEVAVEPAPVEEVTPPVEEPVAPAEPVGVAPPVAPEMGAVEVPEAAEISRPVEVPEAAEIPEPFVRGRAPEAVNPADILGLSNRAGLRKQLQGLDVNNVEDHPKIDAILQKTAATFSAENLTTLENKMKEAQSAQQIESAKPFDAGSSKLPEGGEEIGRAPVSGEGIRASDQEGKGIAGEGQEKGQIIKEVRGEAPKEIEIEGVKRPTVDSTGAPIHTTEEGVKNFWKGFKDSKVADAEGRPIKMYHGTRGDIVSTKDPTQVAFDREGLGAHFTSEPKIATGFAESFGPEAGSVVPVYLDIKNPLRVRDTGESHSEAKEVAQSFIKQNILPKGYIDNAFYDRLMENVTGPNANDIYKENNAKELSRIRDIIASKGYDGLVYENTIEGGGDAYVPFSATQIKSAIGNKGAFDVSKPDIREVRGAVPTEVSPDMGRLPLDVTKFEKVKNARELLSTYMQHGTDENLRAKAKIYQTSPQAGAIQTHFVSMEDKMPAAVKKAFEGNALAATSIGEDKVEVYFRKDDPASFSEDNVLHEVTHAMTEAGLARNPVLRRELDTLAGTIGNAIREDHPEAAKFWNDIVKEDGSEALAYGSTSPSFREILSKYDEQGNRIPEPVLAAPKAEKPRTLWDRFKSFVGRVFGVPDKQKEQYSKDVDSALDKNPAPVLKSMTAKLDQALVQAFKETAKKGITKPTEAPTIHKVSKAEAPTPTKEEAKEAEERLKAAGLTGKITEEPLGTKMRRVTNDIFKEGRNTSFTAEYVDIRQPIAKAVQDLPSNVGEKLRSDYIWGAYEQRGNVLQESYRKGFIGMGRDGTLEAIPDAQLAVENIFKRVGKENAKAFGNVLVAHRVRSIRKKDAEIHAQANKLLNMAEQMEDYASTLKDAAKRKKFNASARSLYKAAEKKLEIINWGEGRTEFSEELAKDADKVLAANPHLAREAENVYALLRKQVDLWEQEGMIDKATANEWRSYPNYFPLYKSSATDAKGNKISYDEMLANPTEYIQKYITPYMGRGAKSLPKVHKQEWHQHAVFVEENLLRHLAFFASAAAEHSARKNTAYNMELLGKAKRVESGKGDFVVKFREKGKDVFYKIEDPAAYYALQSAQPLLNPLLKRMRGVGNFARGVMIKNPLFWFRQVFREPLQASLVGRAGVITPFDVLSEITKISMGKSEGYKRLRAKGSIGPVDVVPDVTEYVKSIYKEKGAVDKFFDTWNHIHEATDAATRAVVYERAKAQAISQGFTEEVADSIGVMKAREIINFAKQGRGDLIRVARATTPFFGAALNSLDVMARAISPEKLGSLSKAEAMEARRNFYSTAMMVAMFSTAYAAAMSEDEDYLKNPDRKGNWLIPIGGGKFIKIPIPFEAGWFIKELPELATLLSLGAINKSEAITEGKTAFKENVLPPMPTVFSIEPLAEVIMDHDFYTGSSLEGRDADVAIRDRNTKAGELTKAIVNKMEDYGINFLGVSANQLEHLNKSYLGQLWAITRAASDAYLNQGKVTPEKTLSEYPMAGGIISEGKKDRAVDQFYRVYGQVSEIDKSKQRAVSIGDKERFDQIVNDPENQKALRASDTLRDIKKQIGEKRTGIAKLKEMKGITSEEMTKRINVLKEQEKALAKRGVEVARKLGLEI